MHISQARKLQKAVSAVGLKIDPATGDTLHAGRRIKGKEIEDFATRIERLTGYDKFFICQYLGGNPMQRNSQRKSYFGGSFRMKDNLLSVLDFSVPPSRPYNESDLAILQFLRIAQPSPNDTRIYLCSDNQYRLISGHNYGTGSSSKVIRTILHSAADTLTYKGKPLSQHLEQTWARLMSECRRRLVYIYSTPMDEEDLEEAEKEFREREFPILLAQSIVNVGLYGVKNPDTGHHIVRDCRIKHSSSRRNELTVYDYLEEAMTRLPAFREAFLVEDPVTYSSYKEVPAINYLPIHEKLDRGGKCPAWKEYLSRYTRDERLVFMAYIWGVLDSKNSGRQALYIYDQGYSGKTAMLNALIKAIGRHVCQSLQKDSMEGRFAMSKIWDKRLITLDDNKNTQILRSEKMHLILGGGSADVEEKGRGSFSYRINSKVIICGNVLPQVEMGFLHERSRVILIRPRLTDKIKKKIFSEKVDALGNQLTIGDNSFEKRLSEEFWAFAPYCEKAYREICPNDADFVLPASVVESMNNLLAAEDSALYEDFVHEHAVITGGEDHYIIKSDLNNRFRARLKIAGMRSGNQECANFNNYLVKRYDKVTMKTQTVEGRRVYVFQGIKWK